MNTRNPSGDDNVFLATFTMNPPVAGISTDGDTMSLSPETSEHILGQTAELTVQNPDADFGLFGPHFRGTVLDGPDTGLDYSLFCNGLCDNGDPHQMVFKAAANAQAGIDTVRVWYDTDIDGVQDPDEKFGTVRVRWTEPVHQTAMGDSYSAGEGVNPYDSGTDVDFGGGRDQCHRSAYAYGRNIKPAGYDDVLPTYEGGETDTRVRFVACSSATTENVKSDGDVQWRPEGASQVDQPYALGEDTDLVTISIGGNDVGFSKVVEHCLNGRCGAPDELIDGVQVKTWAEQRLAALPAKLDTVVSDIKTKAPNATVILLGYPHLFPADLADQLCGKLAPWDPRDQYWMNEMGDKLTGVMKDAGARNGVYYLSPTDRFSGHEICGPNGEWISGLTAPNLFDLFHKTPVGTGSFHPNKDGQISGYAALINSFLASVDDTIPTNAAGLPVNPAPIYTARTLLAAAPAPTAPLADVGDLFTYPLTADGANYGSSTCYTDGLVHDREQMLLVGDGYAPGAKVGLTWSVMANDGTKASRPLGTVSADANGHVETVLTPPAAPVDNYVLVTGLGDSRHGTPLELSKLLGIARPCPDGSGAPATAAYDFTGFFAPVNNAPVVNTVQAGRAIPVKFALAGDQGLDILAAGSPTSRQVSCVSGAPTDEVEQTVAAGASSLQYDAATGRYQYVWKTSSAWVGTCRELTVTLRDGTAHEALFSFR